eukprot:1160464-Pelagomonas_calceolata.AAC.5
MIYVSWWQLGRQQQQQQRQASRKAIPKPLHHMHGIACLSDLLQAFAEKLFSRLQTRNEAFDTRMAILLVVSRVIGVHKLPHVWMRERPSSPYTDSKVDQGYIMRKRASSASSGSHQAAAKLCYTIGNLGLPCAHLIYGFGGGVKEGVVVKQGMSTVWKGPPIDSYFYVQVLSAWCEGIHAINPQEGQGPWLAVRAFIAPHD